MLFDPVQRGGNFYCFHIFVISKFAPQLLLHVMNHDVIRVARLSTFFSKIQVKNNHHIDMDWTWTFLDVNNVYNNYLDGLFLVLLWLAVAIILLLVLLNANNMFS